MCYMDGTLSTENFFLFADSFVQLEELGEWDKSSGASNNCNEKLLT